MGRGERKEEKERERKRTIFSCVFHFVSSSTPFFVLAWVSLSLFSAKGAKERRRDGRGSNERNDAEAKEEVDDEFYRAKMIIIKSRQAKKTHRVPFCCLLV